MTVVVQRPLFVGEPLKPFQLKDSCFLNLILLRHSIEHCCAGVNDESEHPAIEALRLMGFEAQPTQEQIWDWAELEAEHVHPSKADAQWGHLFNDHGQIEPSWFQLIKRDGGWVVTEKDPLKPRRRQVEGDLAELFEISIRRSIYALAEAEHLFQEVQS